ncbi:hypothetical protein PROFUN_15641 [Planoprotostelium fungivorum]|uniref:Uncharacterized protein n=1 Tax=Planoprotostelium fungivorum TaxID=1890364 RepID=A0A2P6MVC7_9EUKA|nr:hypothetical protein PROFUN_15641 [Planoprotostelium fungivorum]
MPQHVDQFSITHKQSHNMLRQLRLNRLCASKPKVHVQASQIRSIGHVVKSIHAAPIVAAPAYTPATFTSLMKQKSFTPVRHASGNDQYVLFPENVEVDKIQFGEVEKNAKGGRFISLFYNRTRLRIQTPILRVPFDIGTNPESEGRKMNLALALDDIGSNEEVAKFLNVVQQIDQKVKDHLVNNSQSLLMTPDPKKAQDKLSKYFSCIKESQEYSPLFKAAIPIYDGEPATRVYLDSEVQGSVENVTKGSRVVAIVEPKSIYMIGPNVGLSWRVSQIRVVEKARSRDEYAFISKDHASS